MARKCKYCYTKANDNDTLCSICKIDINKDKKELTKEEKKLWYCCRTLSLIGFLAALGGLIGVVGAIVASVGLAGDGKNSLIIVIINLILGIAFFIFGISLSRYKQWCYYGGIVLYSLSIILCIVSFNIIAALFSGLFLYYVASKTSKNILYRQL